MNPTILNIPGLRITKLRPYEHRQAQVESAGYSGRITDSGRIYMRKSYNHTIKVSRAWRLGFTNVGNVPVDVAMIFSVHDKYGKLENFAEVYRNLRPGEPAEIFFDVADKKARVMLESVEVHNNSSGQVLSVTEVKRFMPDMAWGVKSWVVALATAFFSLIALSGPTPVNGPAGLMVLIAGVILLFNSMHRTMVYLMALFLLLVPFSSHGIEMKIFLMGLATAYLAVVFRKRHSIKDFLSMSTPA